MADILIRMEMPKSCAVCPFERLPYCSLGNHLNLDAHVTIAYIDGRRKDCPLVELPEHGDLIDVSKISLQEYEQAAHDALHNGKGSILYDCGVLAGARAITQFVRRSPVIVPSNKEDTE